MLRNFSLQIKQTGGTLFGLTASLNGYCVVPNSDGDDPNSWTGQIEFTPDPQTKKAPTVPLVVASHGVAASYDIHYHSNTDPDTAVSRKEADDGTDVWKTDV